MAQLVSSILPKNGYHPISTTTITLDESNIPESCSMYLFFSLPRLLFVDPYELAHHESLFTFRHWGSTNLELPVGALRKNDSHILLNASFPNNARVIEVKLPLHLRYGDLSESHSQDAFHAEAVPWPVGFFHCPVSISSPITASSNYLPRLPSEVISLLASPSAAFVPISHSGGDTFTSTNIVQVPIGTLGDLAYVEFGTVFTILFSFFHLVRACRRPLSRIHEAALTKTD